MLPSPGPFSLGSSPPPVRKCPSAARRTNRPSAAAPSQLWKRGSVGPLREQRRKWPKGRERRGAERLPGSRRTRWAGPGQDGGRAARERVLHGPLVSPPADAAVSQWDIFRPLFPGHAPDDRVQKSGFQLPSELPGPRPDFAVSHGDPGSNPAVLWHQGQPDGSRGATGHQPDPHRGRFPAVRLLPALADPGAAGRLDPQCHAADVPQPGGRPAGGGHRCLHQLDRQCSAPGTALDRSPPGSPAVPALVLRGKGIFLSISPV